jgi:plastocyanin
MWGCEMGSPSSPSAITRSTPGGQLRPHEEPSGEDPYPPDPGAPDPGVPPVTPMPPLVSARTINIIGTAGANAFAPNPLAIQPGEMIVWMNDDERVHHIMLDDGTDVGTVAPGQPSVPIALVNPTATYHCTLHPSMVGSISDSSVVAPPGFPVPPAGPDPEPYPEPGPYPYATPRAARR